MADNIQKNKSANISAIMNDDNLSNEVIKGIGSPLGSSERDKAHSVLSSLNRTAMGEKNIDPSQPRVGIGESSVSGKDLGIDDSMTFKQEKPSIQEEREKRKEAFPDLPYSPLLDREQQEEKKEEKEEESQRTETFPSPSKTASTKNILKQAGVSTEGLADEQTKKGFYGDWYSGLSDEDKKKYQPLYESVRSGVGASTFAETMMSDTEKLKNLLPDVPEEALPSGASVVGQLNELEENLRDEYELDSMHQNLQELAERGLTIEDDIESYITARDEQVEKVGSLIDKTKNQMANMSNFADPNTSERMNNYMDYLYVLKGRQQKRYADFLDSSINYYDQKVTRAENRYNNAKENFQTELENKKELTKDQHERFKTMLEDMYNNLDSRAETESNKLQKQLDNLSTKYNTALDVVEANETLKTYLSGEGTNNVSWDNLTDRNKIKAQNKFYESFQKGGYGNIEDAKKTWDKLPNHVKTYYLDIGTSAQDIMSMGGLPGVNEQTENEQTTNTSGSTTNTSTSTQENMSFFDL